MDDSKSFGRARLSFSTEADINEFAEKLEQFEKGELSSDQWRAFRLLRGTYGQRQDDVQHMLRVKVPQGILSAEALYALADVGERHSRGFGHITTRQNIQFHFVRLEDAEAAMRRLDEAGLTTREACGNSVRNITGCPYAGVSKDEVFDIAPYADALTRYLLRHPLSSSLPRKFKIAFEGCAEDHVATSINDLGFRAQVRSVDGKTVRGFRVTVAGGTAILCTNAYELHDFAPAEDLFQIAEAVVRIFHRLGDRKHRQKNRLKFLVKQLGWNGFLAEYQKERAQFFSESDARPSFDVQSPPGEPPPSWTRPPPPTVAAAMARASSSVVRGPGIVPEVKPARAEMNGDLARFMKTNVRAQKQDGHSVVTVHLPLGDFTGEQMRLLGDLARSFGDGEVRVTMEQNLVFRWVRNEDVPKLYELLSAMGVGRADANTVADVTSCPGAETCKLAVTQSRGLGKLLGDFLSARPDLVALVPDVKIKMSGCPNGCGQHHIAGIGFQGSIRKVGDKVAPQYFVLVGGGIVAAGAKFGRIAAKVPARRIPTVVERLLTLYRDERAPGEAATAYFQRVELPKLKGKLCDLEQISPETAQPDDFIDLGEAQEFKPETGEGECAA